MPYSVDNSTLNTVDNLGVKTIVILVAAAQTRLVEMASTGAAD